MLSQRTVVLANLQKGRAGEIELMPTIYNCKTVSQMILSSAQKNFH